MRNLPQVRRVGVNDIRCSADRVQNEAMSAYHVTSHVIMQAWCMKLCRNNFMRYVDQG